MPVRIRINDLARELEVKSKAILDVLLEIGITEKKTHSSSVSGDEAERVRRHFLHSQRSAARPGMEIRPKIDFSRIHRPGDIANLLKQQEASPARSPHFRSLPETPPAAQPTLEQDAYRLRTTAVPEFESFSGTSKTHIAETVPPRVILPQTGPRPIYTTKKTTGRAKQETSTFAKPEQKSPNQDAIEQAEEALRALRAQEKLR
jgi:translation initiation factor IF-2